MPPQPLKGARQCLEPQSPKALAHLMEDYGSSDEKEPTEDADPEPVTMITAPTQCKVVLKSSTQGLPCAQDVSEDGDGASWRLQGGHGTMYQ